MAVFNAKEYRDQNPEQRTLPTGWYKVKVETSQLKQSSAGDDMVTMSIRILDSLSGHFINALQWENLVIGHPNDQTRRIANDKLAEICLASGVDEIRVWGDIAEEGKEFAMSIGKSEKTGRIYAVYRSIDAWEAKLAKQGKAQPAPMFNGQAPVLAPAPPLDDYIDDIPF